jgi:Leucine-rich repeat (LRR) protein
MIFNQVVLNKIYENLPLGDLFNCSLVNKKFNKGFNSSLIWESLFKRDYNENINDYKEILKMDNNKSIFKTYFQLTILKKHLKLKENIKSLVNLRILHLDYNGLSTIPKEIGSLVNLQKLYLNCNILVIISKEIGSLNNLQELHLDANKLTILPCPALVQAG